MKVKAILIVLVLLALFALAPLAGAQEPTEAPTPEVVEVEAGESTEVTIPEETTEIVVTTEEPPAVVVEQDAPNYYMLIVALASALFGVLAGGGTVAVVLARANNNAQLKDTTEDLLHKSVPQSVIDDAHRVTNRVLDILESVGKPALTFVRDVTDGQPNTGAQG